MGAEDKVPGVIMQRKGSVINEICLLYDRLSDTEKLIADLSWRIKEKFPR